MIGVSVIDDHPLYREGLAGMLEEAGDLQLVSSHPSIEEFDRSHPPTQVVLLDLYLPGGMEGARGVSHLSDLGYAILVLSTSTTSDDVTAAFSAGARGYLGKDADAQQIIQAVATVAGGSTYMSPSAASVLLDVARPARKELTPREREVLNLVAEGATNKAIARELAIEQTTVRSHLERIRDKTGCRRRAELTRLAVYLGIVKGHRPPAGNEPGGHNPPHR